MEGAPPYHKGRTSRRSLLLYGILLGPLVQRENLNRSLVQRENLNQPPLVQRGEVKGGLSCPFPDELLQKRGRSFYREKGEKRFSWEQGCGERKKPPGMQICVPGGFL